MFFSSSASSAMDGTAASPRNAITPIHRMSIAARAAVEGRTQVPEIAELLEDNGKIAFSYKKTIAAYLYGQRIARIGYRYFSADFTTLMFNVLLVSVHLVLFSLGFLQVIPKYWTIVGTVTQIIHISIVTPFIVQWPVARLLLFTIDSFLYFFLTVFATVTLSLCMNWDERSSIIGLLFIIVWAAMMNDAFSIPYLRFLWLFNLQSAFLTGLLGILLSLGQIRDINDVIFLNLGKLDGISKQVQAWSALQVSISSFFTLSLLFFRLSIHSFLHRSKTNEPIMMAVSLPIFVMDGDAENAE